MLIQLNKIRPAYLEPEKISGSEIWNQQVTFESRGFIEITASSGRGKSSLIHFIYGLKNDFDGTIRIDDQDTSKMNLQQTSNLRSNKLAIVFQDLKLIESETCRQNILVKSALTGFGNTDSMEKMAERLGVKNKLNSKAGNCSYGERQRIAIIRALHQPFEYLLLDEPFSHLDEKNRDKAAELILEEVENQKAGIILADLESKPSFPAKWRFKL